MFGGHLIEAVSQLRHESVVTVGQQTVDLLCDPPIIQQALSGGGRERRREGQLIQH